ncbi:hypothetical protein [Mycolicibacterium sp.]|uniref:hypothetical protein n=1 Tax=Mycolicibacterium sp. TaxID=2320850 RepID=UPI001A30A003|nr:hypothetical protein [Mycolicibacterium sp.]MBJ7336877.1 hypothetical protein [Mycolicibacterium sp.]
MNPRRRRLLVLSAPVAVVVLLVIVKMWSVVIAGGSAASEFAERDSGALRGDVDTLGVLNVIEPAKAYVAAGSLAVLDDRLSDADGRFTEALAHTDPARSCPVRVDLEFVRETLGDRSATALDGASAAAWYRGALAAVESAPADCFTGSADPDEQRRALLDDAASRLEAKLAAALAIPPAPPPPPDAPPPPPPPPSSTTTTTRTEPDGPLRLDPGSGDPLDRLQQILRDAAAAQNGG